MEFLVFLGVATLISFVGLATYYHGAKATRLPLLVTSERCAIADAPADARVTLVGRVALHQQVLSTPLSQRGCVAYLVEVDLVTDDGETRSISRVVTERRAVPFWIEVDAGRALVDCSASAADLLLHFEHTAQVGGFDVPNPLEAALLKRHSIEAANQTFMYREFMLAVGEPVTVEGWATREPDPTPAPTSGYRSSAPTMVRLSRKPGQPLVVSELGR